MLIIRASSSYNVDNNGWRADMKIKKTVAVLLTFSIICGILAAFSTSEAGAAAKPGVPTVTLQAASDNSGIEITIGKTDNADGFAIYLRSPDSSKLKKVKTLKKNGSSVRTFTIGKLEPGKYTIRVKAYTKSGSKKVWGAYSKNVKIVLGKTKADKDGTETDAMVIRAFRSLLIPEEKLDKLDSTITFAEFSYVLTSVVDKYRPKLSKKWSKIIKAASKSKESMNVEDGYLMISYLWVLCGFNDDYNKVCRYWEPWAEDDDEQLINAQMDCLSWDYPYFPDWETISYPLYRSNYMWGAVSMFPNELSPVDGSNMFVFDKKEETLHLNEPLSWRTAARAAQCLSEIIELFTYVSDDELKCLVTEESIEIGKKMPEVSWNNIPDWHGFTYGIFVQPTPGECAYGAPEEYIARLAGDGFNFVRVPLSYFASFYKNDTSKCNLLMFEMMDDLVNKCAKYGIHVCFDLHDMPGFTTDSDDSDDILFTDAKTQKKFAGFWKMIAKHYENVPTNLVSFNLLNEPHPHEGEELTEKVYAKVMRLAINAIREITPDRLIVVDFLGMIDGHPAEGLADDKVVQSAHPYFLDKRTSKWPLYIINGFANKQNGELTIKGSFKKGTVLSFDPAFMATPCELTIVADGKEIASCVYGDEETGPDGFPEIHDEGNGNEWRRYFGKSVTATLPADCSEIKLLQSGKGTWYSLHSIIIGDVYIIGNNWYVEDDENVPVLTVEPDGTITAQTSSTLMFLNKDVLKEQFASYVEFRERTGEAIMVQEFGFHSTIPQEVNLAASRDILEVMKEYDIPWCCWESNVGPVMDRIWASQPDQDGLKTVYREGATYKDYVDKYVYDAELLDLYKEFMNHGDGSNG